MRKTADAEEIASGPRFQGSPRMAERYASMIPNIGLKNDRIQLPTAG